MEDKVLDLAMQQGIWAVLFITLLFFVLNENSKRESKYQEIISQLTDKFQCIEEGLNCIKEDVKEVKDKIFK
ncbi:BhlA/UviB family holin-like peptide [Clostridium sp. OS1-26]|uniref:BhlA/UviB family holin-like peptide n=1 Tax=Clostridium sp. OS1-26 TaxID=3070681 RepID=UPI0027DF3EF9|nr:BhlA/UviB family holin-like peptide [Clostridium sp. OS1-26]WML35927.1 BhlA/UviB family holin-like peptide [Clostridium sp. OS1-26]